MRRNQYQGASAVALVDEYAATGERQQRAIEEWDNRTYNRLYPKREAIAAELQNRPEDQRTLLLPLLQHPSVQIRLNAGQELKTIAPAESRQALQSIADSKYFPYAADAALILDDDFLKSLKP